MVPKQQIPFWDHINRLTPNDPYMGHTAPLTSKHCILYIYSTNVGTEYFKHALYSPFFSLQNAACFIMLTSLGPVLFTFYIQNVLRLRKHNSGAKGLSTAVQVFPRPFPQILLLQGCSLQTRYAQLYALSMSGVCFLTFLKVIFLLSPFENLHHSLFYLSTLFLTFFSSSMFQMHL